MSVKDIILAGAGAGAASGGASGDTDPYFANTTLLLQGDVSNPDLSYNAFSDASGNERNITPNGDAIGSSFSPHNTSWSNYFNSSSDYLQKVTGAESLRPGTGDFTFEFWHLNTEPSVYDVIFELYEGGTRQCVSIQIGGSTSGAIFVLNGSVVITTSGGNPFDGQWHHHAIVRNGTNLTYYIDGVNRGSATDSTNVSVGNSFIIGEYSSGSYNLVGYVSNFRAVIGTAVYTSAFTPPTTPLTAISGTELLTCQSNRFVDNSSNGFAITTSGNVAVKAFAPFLDTDTTTGSGYFDGSGDYLATSRAITTADFTIEAWIYLTSSGSNYCICSQGTAGTTGRISFYVTSISVTNGLALQISSSYIYTPTSLKTNRWYYVAARRSSNTTQIYINGVLEVSGSNSDTPQNTNFVVGAEWGPTAYFPGYISNLRVSDNARTITVPTSPATSDANTSLLTCQTRGAVRNIGFRDESEYNHLITKVGNCAQGTFSPFSQEEGKWSNYFDRSGDRLTLPNTPVLQIEPNDFTIECWINPFAVDGSLDSIASRRAYGATEGWFFGLAGNLLRFGGYINGAWSISWLVGNIQIVANTFTHVAVTKSGTSVRLFVNGVLDNTGTLSTTSSIQSPASSKLFCIGDISYDTSQGAWPGYISNLRVTNAALYTSNFTPSTTPLTTTVSSGTVQLLTCQSNRFVDNSNNGFTVTVVGNTSVQPFSPFAPSAAYSPSVNGGSGYFDGSGDWLKLSSSTNATNYRTGDFTVEFWFYTNSVSTQQNILDNLGNSAVALYIPAGGGSIRYYVGADRITGGAITPNQWYHIALVRSSGSTKLYLNGTQTGSTYADTNNYAGGSTFPFIGVSYLDTLPINGYMAGLRIVKGTAVYTTAFTPPTEPLTAITNTSLLLNFTNAGIFDNTGKNNLETVGNAHVETSVKKYGTGALEFDGTGDALTIPASPNFAFGTGDFTIEFWAYFNSIDQYDTIYIHGNTNNTVQLFFVSGKLRYNNNSVVNILDTTTTIPTGQWVHLAIVRSSGTATWYLNGTADGTVSDSTNWASFTTNLTIGRDPINGRDMNGYIDDLRITKGVARYTANFTPPTKSLPNQ